MFQVLSQYHVKTSPRKLRWKSSSTKQISDEKEQKVTKSIFTSVTLELHSCNQPGN